MSEQKRPASEELPTFDDPADLVNAVISTLQVPEERTNVAICFANDKNVATEVQAYAKIAGRDWTYYVKTLAVSIGRNTDVPLGDTPQEQQQVQIDLGPAKIVSRQHAAITYNIDLRCWELKVLGRNGARIDGAKMPVGAHNATPLHSGAILDVGGTQMMFILPDTPPSISPKMLSSCLARYRSDMHKMPRLSHGRSTSAPDLSATPMHGMRGTGFQSMSSFQMFEKGSLAHSPSSVSAVSLQNNLDQDLSKEDSKDIKPPYSYATMITQAILSNPDGVMSLSEIYNWISSRYAYYKYSKTGWQNSIRHNLSLNKAFEKVPRRPNEPGKGMKWQISDSYRNDFLKKVQTGTLSKSRRGSSVSRTLQIHLATHQGLPDTKLYSKSETAGAASGTLDHQQTNPPNQMNTGSNMLTKAPQQLPYPPMQAGPMNSAYGMQHAPPHNGYQMPYGNANYQKRPVIYAQPNQQPNQQQPQQQPNQQQPHQQPNQKPQQQPNQQQQPHPQQQPNQQQAPNQHQHQFQQQQNLSQQQLQPPQPQLKMELASPLRHASMDSNSTKNSKIGTTSYNQQPPNPNGANHGNAPSFAPGINLFKMTPTQPKVDTNTPENGGGRNSFSNTSHIPNTSESMIQNSTAPTTSNTSELGLNFTSPKKIVPLEAFTPERGSKSVNLGKSGGNANVNQSSPAFWNFVQFSTPNGQTPGRKNSEGSNGPESPTLNRGSNDKNAANIYEDSPPK
ncbi:hypothetical protein JCM33374_g4108 [Metschnikowia sp. JCM 33374]|nr:hypothetical protein JCM33374_g4108 [Metschnikowia sp. JCM 33374]